MLSSAEQGSVFVPATCLMGASTHSASLVRMMLITAYSTLPHCPAAPLYTPHTHLYMCRHTHTHSHTKRCTQSIRKTAKIRPSKQATCKCNHKQISSESTGNGRAFINTRGLDTKHTHPKINGHNSLDISAISTLLLDHFTSFCSSLNLKSFQKDVFFLDFSKPVSKIWTLTLTYPVLHSWS